MWRLLFLLPLLACADEPDPRVFHLTQMNGAPFAARATISFPDAGKVAGHAPCNRYSGTLTGRMPSFGTGPLLSTKMACADLGAEAAFFAALGQMTHADMQGGTLTLTDDAGHEMRFTAQE